MGVGGGGNRNHVPRTKLAQIHASRLTPVSFLGPLAFLLLSTKEALCVSSLEQRSVTTQITAANPGPTTRAAKRLFTFSKDGISELAGRLSEG